MKKKLVLITLATLVLIVSAAFGWMEYRDRATRTHLFDGTTEILLDEAYGGENPVSTKITDPQKVAAIVDKIRLIQKGDGNGECACAHWAHIVFKTPRGPIKASFCGHCFDVSIKGEATGYGMPKPLLRELQAMVDHSDPRWHFVMYQ